MSEPCQDGETQAGSSQSDLNQDQKLAVIEGQLQVLLDEVHQLREEMAQPENPDQADPASS
ncbi:hypothetical protein D9M68_546250 [compost metagenome]